MPTYRHLWNGLVLLLLMVGVCAGLLLSPGATPLVFLVAGTAGALVGAALRPRRAVRDAVLSGLTAAGMVGLALVDDRLFLGIGLLVGLTAPAVVAWVGQQVWPRRRARDDRPWILGRIGTDPTGATGDRAGPDRPGLDLARELGQLTDDQLCRAWRRSFATLHGAGSTAQRLAAVELRQAYLDELERRCPEAVEAWLDAGGRAASGPEKFFRDAARDGAARPDAHD